MSRYSIVSLFRHAFSHHENWPPAWRDPDPKPKYDVVIVGGGGHGLATAYHLAKEHGITNVAVLEKGWIGGGNTGRNGTIIRSNFVTVVMRASTLSAPPSKRIFAKPRGCLLQRRVAHGY